MIHWLETHPKITWLITLTIALTIFYLSSLTFEPSTIPKFPYKSIFYHFTIFFFLSIFLQISLTKGKNKKLIPIAIVTAILYGISDEIHQLFVPSRACSLFDILTNSTGILLAAVVYANSLNKN